MAYTRRVNISQMAHQLSHVAISPFERGPFTRRYFFDANERNIASL